MATTVLPAEHRRLRHVLQFACRHAPVFPSGSASRRSTTNAASQANTQFTLRHIQRDGSPGDLLYESEVQLGTVHPLWSALPTSITLNEHPNTRSLVFSLYRVSGAALEDNTAHRDRVHRGRRHVQQQKEDDAQVCPTEARSPVGEDAPSEAPGGSAPGVASSPTTQDGTATDTELEDGSHSPMCDLETEDTQTPTAAAADGRQRGASIGELTTEATIVMVRRDSIDSSGGGTRANSLAPAPPPSSSQQNHVDTKQQPIANNATSISSVQETTECGNDNITTSHSSKHLIFECLIDFTKTEFLAKHLTGLHDIGALPAHMDDGHRSFTILLRCHDGIFSPTMDASFADANANSLDLKRPTPSLYGLFLGGARGQQQVGGTFLQHTQQLESEWDLVDGDAAREAEARQQKTESMTLGDIKALGSASIALKRMQVALKTCAEERRHQIDDALHHEEGAAVVAVRNAVTDVTTTTCSALVAARRAQIAEVEKDIATRRAALDARRQAITKARAEALPTTTAAVSSSPTAAAGCSDELQVARRRLAVQIVDWFQVNPAANTILGVKLPAAVDAVPETADHAMGVYHIAHAVTVFSRLYNVTLPHPMYFAAPGRCRVYERLGVAPEKYFPLYPVKNSERGLLRRGMDLLRQNIVSAAYSIHNQRQAEGLPLVLATEKLLVGR